MDHDGKTDPCAPLASLPVSRAVRIHCTSSHPPRLTCCVLSPTATPRSKTGVSARSNPDRRRRRPNEQEANAGKHNDRPLADTPTSSDTAPDGARIVRAREEQRGARGLRRGRSGAPRVSATALDHPRPTAPRSCDPPSSPTRCARGIKKRASYSESGSDLLTATSVTPPGARCRQAAASAKPLEGGGAKNVSSCSAPARAIPSNMHDRTVAVVFLSPTRPDAVSDPRGLNGAA